MTLVRSITVAARKLTKTTGFVYRAATVTERDLLQRISVDVQQHGYKLEIAHSGNQIHHAAFPNLSFAAAKVASLTCFLLSNSSQKL